MSAPAWTPEEYELEVAPHEVLWDTWVLAEMAAELALFVWRTVPIAERAAAHDEYTACLEDEESAAALLDKSVRAALRMR
jgi:hypothetical protein